VTPPWAWPQTSISGTAVGKVVAGEVACLVAEVFIVVGVGLQDEEAPEKGCMQFFASQWAAVVPHQPYWEPVIYR
jgi:hypothetical protein